MKILFLVQRYHPVVGGAEIHAKHFIEFLSKHHDVTVFTTNAKDLKSFWNNKAEKNISNTEFQNYSVHRFDFITPENIIPDENLFKFQIALNHPGPFSPKLWEDLFVSNQKFDLILAMSYPYDHIIPAYAAAKKWKIPIIITPLIHQQFPELFLTGLRLTMLKNADAVTVSTNSEKMLLENLGIDGKKIFKIPPGVDQPNTKQNNSKNFKKKYGISENANIILFVGYKEESKGITHLIEAMKLLWKKRLECFLVLIGCDTPEFIEYFSKQSEKIKKMIIDLGEIDEQTKHSAFEACDFFVMPSKSESFGLTYLEAWTHSKPVIGCKIPSSIELIDENKNGLLTEYGNIQELTNSITFFLDNEIKRKDFGQKGREKSLKFDWKKSCEDLEILISDVVNKTKESGLK